MPFPPKTSLLQKQAPATSPGPPIRQASNPLQTSASQFKTWSRCRRLWWLDKVAKVRPPQKGYLTLGKTLHALAERYQLKHPLYPVGWDRTLTAVESQWMRLCADMAIAKGLWQADPQSIIEDPVCCLVDPNLVDDRGMPLLCRADVAGEGDDRYIKPPTIMHPEHAGIFSGLPLLSANPDDDWTRVPYLVGFLDVNKPHLSPPEIHDHKTAKHKNYAKSSKSLAVDEQMLTYACIMLARRHTATEVIAQHNVFLKNYDKGVDPVYPVRATITLAAAQVFWAEFTKEVAESQRLRRSTPSPAQGLARADAFDQVPGLIPVQNSVFSSPSAEDLVLANAKDGCGAYGGCFMRDACQGKKKVRDVVAEIDSANASGRQLVTNRPALDTRPQTDYTLKPRGTALGTRLFFPKNKG